MKAIVRAAAGLALVLAAGTAAAQPAPRPDAVIREIEADVLAAILRSSGISDVTVRDQRGESPAVDFKTRGGLDIHARFSRCQRGNHPTRCSIVWYQYCWTRAQLGRDLPDAAAVNAFNMSRSTAWAVLDTRGSEPRACIRHAHIISNGTLASAIAQNAQVFATSYVETFRRQFGQQSGQAAPAPAQTPAPAPAQTPAPAQPAQPAPAQPATPEPAMTE